MYRIYLADPLQVPGHRQPTKTFTSNFNTYVVFSMPIDKVGSQREAVTKGTRIGMGRPFVVTYEEKLGDQLVERFATAVGDCDMLKPEPSVGYADEDDEDDDEYCCELCDGIEPDYSTGRDWSEVVSRPEGTIENIPQQVSFTIGLNNYGTPSILLDGYVVTALTDEQAARILSALIRRGDERRQA